MDDSVVANANVRCLLHADIEVFYFK